MFRKPNSFTGLILEPFDTKLYNYLMRQNFSCITLELMEKKIYIDLISFFFIFIFNEVNFRLEHTTELKSRSHNYNLNKKRDSC